MIGRSTLCTVSLSSLFVGGLVAGFASASQDDPKKAPEKLQTIVSEGIQFDAPQSWKTLPPTSQMRKAHLRVSPAEGDSEPADLVLFVFPGGAGGVEANVERWRKQFGDADGDAPEVETSKVKGANTDVTRVEVAGTYTDPFAGGGPREGYRLYGAIVTTERSGYFFKMVGPDKTMKQAKAAFDQMLTTIKTK